MLPSFRIYAGYDTLRDFRICTKKVALKLLPKDIAEDTDHLRRVE